EPLERLEQSVGVLVLHVALHALGTEHAAIERKLLPRLKADNLIVFDLELDPALLAAEAAVRLYEFVGFGGSVPAARGHVATVWTEAMDKLFDCNRKLRHLSLTSGRA